MDFIMDLPKSKAGHGAILVVVDKLSKMTLIPTNSTFSAQQVAQLFLKDVYRLLLAPALLKLETRTCEDG
jgi:hypothetical protein